LAQRPSLQTCQIFHAEDQSTSPSSTNLQHGKQQRSSPEAKKQPTTSPLTFASLDITYLYSNIPVAETKIILADFLKQKLIDTQTQTELLNWYEVITKQNYFSNNNDIAIHNDSLAVGSPSSGLIAEIFLQHTENSHLTHLTKKHKIIN